MCQADRPDQPIKFGVDYDTFDVGLLYSKSKSIDIGFMVKNVYQLSGPDGFHSGLKEIDSDYSFKLPRYMTLGICYKKKNLIWSFDNETIFGEYGGTGHKKAEFWFIRSGIEKKTNGLFTYRAGLIIPIIAKTSTTGDLRKNIPFPKMSGPLGIGINVKKWTFDFAVYGDPGRSYAEQKPKLQCISTITLKM